VPCGTVGQAVGRALGGLGCSRTGILYGLLDRIGEAVVDGRLRRYYRLTDQGSAAVVMETARLRALTHRARTVLGAYLAFADALHDLCFRQGVRVRR
jgi:hypothetical protein